MFGKLILILEQNGFFRNNQAEYIDYDVSFALVARLEFIRMLIAFSSHKGFKLYK